MPLYPQLQLDFLVQQLINSDWLSFNELMQTNLPIQGGIYRICDFSSSPQNEVYIGISDNLRRRVYGNHFNGGVGNSTLIRKLVNNGHYENAAAVHIFLETHCRAQHLVISNERLRCFVEHYAVAILQPTFND